MATKLDPQVWGEEIEQAFGPLDVNKIWLLVSWARHARLRCRSNAALYNFLRKAFPDFDFSEVEKQNKMGQTYMGLQITKK